MPIARITAGPGSGRPSAARSAASRINSAGVISNVATLTSATIDSVTNQGEFCRSRSPSWVGEAKTAITLCIKFGAAACTLTSSDSWYGLFIWAFSLFLD